jgi:putative Holliday junction resolvase
VVEEYDAVGLIVGLPLSLSGKVGPAATAILAEVEELRSDLGIPCETHDERFTTVTAAESLAASGRRGAKQRALVDQVAAAIILQSWIDGPGGRR